MATLVMIHGCLAVVAVAAMRHFGVLDGAAVVAALWLLMPQVRLSE